MRRPKIKFPRPLKIHCGNLSKAVVANIAYRLKFHFQEVEIFGNDTIFAAKPFIGSHYAIAWKIFDRYGLTVT